MASLLAPYESEEALGVARELDAKIETLLKTVADNRQGMQKHGEESHECHD
jgi:hypothetical protein